MNPIHILLVEDNEGDVVLTTEALKSGTVANRISVARDGREAMDFMSLAIDAPDQMPDLILLDINLPKVNGHEVLKFLKADEKYRKVPVIMLTTSSSQSDIQKSYRKHANCYITKPVELGDFFSSIASIEEFWFSIAQLPSYTSGRRLGFTN